jgi:hypothetical protein
MTNMTKLLTLLGLVGAASTTLASILVWTLLTEPTAVMSAASSGSVWSFVMNILTIRM